jgi:hypothetical protein
MGFKNIACAICERGKESDAKFCEYHNIAYHNIEQHYNYWKEAYDDLSWEAYLKLIIDNSEDGIWVKEVAKYLITEK